MNAYLAIVDRSGLRALIIESPEAAHFATEMLGCVPASTCYWAVVEKGTAAILREMLDEDEPSLAMRFLQSQARECGPATIMPTAVDRAA